MTEIRIRTGNELDAAALQRLAILDSQATPQGSTLIAEVDGEMVAALPLDGGSRIADPFRHTLAPLSLLELRATQLAQPDAGRISWRTRLLGRLRHAAPRRALRL